MTAEVKQTCNVQEFCIYVLPIIVTLAIYLLKSQIKIYWTVYQLNGPSGNIWSLTSDNFMKTLSHTAYNEYGRIFRMWFGLFPIVFIMEPDDVQKLLGNSKHLEKPVNYHYFKNFIGSGLLASDAKTWRYHRKSLIPGFHHNVLEKFIESYAECADRLTGRLAKFDGEKLDITKFVNSVIGEIVLETILGVDTTGMVDENGNVNLNDLLSFRVGQPSVTYRFSRPWLHPDILYKLTSFGKQDMLQGQGLNKTCRRMLEKKRHLLKNQESRKFSLLEHMIKMNEQNPESFTNEDIIIETGQFLLTGLDTVQTTVALIIFLLANHPHCQDKCHEELNKIFAEGDANRSPTWQDLKDMRWLECCIKETLRLYPAAPLVSRILEEDVQFGKHVIPAGANVTVAVNATQRLPHHFPDPHSFRPERFNDQNSKEIHPFAYVPFGAGPRKCIASKFSMLEMKTIVSAVLRRYRLSSVEGKTEARLKFCLTIRASGGLWIKINQRTAEDKCIHSQ